MSVPQRMPAGSYMPRHRAPGFSPRRRILAAALTVAAAAAWPVTAHAASDGSGTTAAERSAAASVGATGWEHLSDGGDGGDAGSAAQSATQAAATQPGTRAGQAWGVSHAGRSTGLPFQLGVFAHDGTGGKTAEFAETIGRDPDLHQIAPQREEGDEVMLSETERTLLDIPHGTSVDYAYPIEGAGMGHGMGAKLGRILATKTDANVYVRPGWEFNIPSWDWSVSRIGPDAFKEGFAATARGIKSTCPRCLIVWNPNSGQGGVQKALDQGWPGDGIVDVIGVDTYGWAEEDELDGPGQLNEWAAQARAMGLMIALPEWGAHNGDEGSGDDAEFITASFEWAARNADIVAYMSYFSEDDDYIQNVPDRMLPRVGDALRAGVAKAAGAQQAQPQPSSEPQEAQQARALPGDATSREFTDHAGTTSTYHLFTSRVTGPFRGLVVYLDGDGHHGHDNPGSDYALGGDHGIIAAAGRAGYATLSAAPPGGEDTWWRDGERNAGWVAALVAAVREHTGAPDVAIVAYSGGSQLATKWLLPAYPDLASLVVVTGGGGAPERVPVARPGTRLVWRTGTADTAEAAEDGYDAAGDARSGSDAYQQAGWAVTFEAPEGVGHSDLAGQFGLILASHLGAAGPVSTGRG